MRHLEGKEGEMGKQRRGRRQATPAEHGGTEERGKKWEEGRKKKNKPRGSYREIDDHRGTLWKLNCSKRPTKHHKHCP